MIRRLLLDRTAASAAEFALVLPLMLILMFGIIDGGRWMWMDNRAAKAAQMGARFAVVADPVSSDVSDSYLGLCSPPLTQGDQIPADCFSTVTCVEGGCSSGTYDADNFHSIVNWMRLFMPDIQNSNVTIEYSPSGLGYAGDPNGADLSPLVTVKLSDLQFRPLTTLMFASFDIPSSTSTLSAEDLRGSQSN